MRRMRRMIVVLGMLALLVSLATVALATSIMVDGAGSDWAASDYQDSDAAEPDVPDQYDIVPAYATTDVDNGTFCIRYDTEADLYLNGGSFTQIYFDLDRDSGTGATQTCQSGFGSIGAERYVYWVMGSLDMCAIFEWDSGWQLVSMDCNGEPHGAGQKSGASVEVCANAQDLGIEDSFLPSVKVFFENGDASEPPPADDIFCFNYQPTPLGAIGDFVWHDLFHSQDHQVDGIQDAGELGIQGVVVELYDGTGQYLGSTITDASGWYEFTDLPAGDYTVKIADSNFGPGGVLEGWYASPANRGTDDALDSDGDETTHQSATVTLGEGEINHTIDFGFFKTCIDLQKFGPIEVQVGDQVVYHFVLVNCGDVVHHGGAYVYDPLINPNRPHQIWWGIVWPGQVIEFDRVYTTKRDDCGELINTATAVGHPKHPDGYYLGNVTDQASWTVQVVCDGSTFEGCTPCYWKQQQHFDSWVTYRPRQWFHRVFGVPYYKTLITALTRDGSGRSALGRQAVAALLNAANPDVNYFYTTGQVIQIVKNAYRTGRYARAKRLLEVQNQLGCPLN